MAGSSLGQGQTSRAFQDGYALRLCSVIVWVQTEPHLFLWSLGSCCGHPLEGGVHGEGNPTLPPDEDHVPGTRDTSVPCPGCPTPSSRACVGLSPGPVLAGPVTLCAVVQRQLLADSGVLCVDKEGSRAVACLELC